MSEEVEKVAKMEMMASQVSALNHIIIDIDFDIYLDNIDRAHTLLPMLDPTAYMRSDIKGSDQFRRLIRKYKELQEVLIELKEELEFETT